MSPFQEDCHTLHYDGETLIHATQYGKDNNWDTSKIDELAEKVYEALCNIFGKNYVDSIFKKLKPDFTGPYAKYAQQLGMTILGPEPVFYCSRRTMSYFKDGFKYDDICTAIPGRANEYISDMIGETVRKMWIINGEKDVILIAGSTHGITDFDRMSEFSGVPRDVINKIIYFTKEMEPIDEFCEHYHLEQ